jgi:predicted Zn-dependent peptidase
MGAVLNAYTSHDLVAFHITCRAEVAGEALDLLSDFVGRPRIDADELDRERGVVIQEIARANDQPAVLAEHLIDRAAFGDHPLGRPVLGLAEHLRSFTRDAIVAFRSRQWAGSRGGAFLVGNLSGVPDDSELVELLCRFPSIQSDGGSEPAPPFAPQTLVEGRESNQSHLRMSYRPSIDPTDVRQRAALGVYSTLLGGSMGSRLFDEIREQRGLAYSVYSVDHAFADVPILQLSAGLDSTKTVEAFTRMGEIVDELRSDGPTEDEFERARAYAAGRRVLAFENTNAVARYAANQTVVFGEDIDPDQAIAALDETTLERVAEVASGVSVEASVACVGPHEVSEFG